MSGTTDDVTIRIKMSNIASFVSDVKAGILSIDDFGKQVEKTGTRVKDAVAKKSGGFNMMDAVVGRMRYAMAGVVLQLPMFAAQIARSAVSSIASFQQVEVAYTNMLGSKGKADEQIKRLQNFANYTPFQFYGDEGIAKMAQQLEAVGVSASALVGKDGRTGGILGALGDATASIGGTGADMSTAVRDIVTMITRGKLTGMEVRDLSTHGVMISKYLEEQFHLTPAQLEKVIAKGKVTANTAIAAIVKGVESSKAANAMKVQSQTLNGLLTTLKDEWAQLQVNVLMPYLPTMTRWMKDLVDFVGEPTTVKRVQDFFTSVGGGIGQIYDALTSKGVERLLGDLWSAVKWVFNTSLHVSSGLLDFVNTMTGNPTKGKTVADVISQAANSLAILLEDKTFQSAAKLVLAFIGIQKALEASVALMETMAALSARITATTAAGGAAVGAGTGIGAVASGAAGAKVAASAGAGAAGKAAVGAAEKSAGVVAAEGLMGWLKGVLPLIGVGMGGQMGQVDPSKDPTLARLKREWDARHKALLDSPPSSFPSLGSKPLSLDNLSYLQLLATKDERAIPGMATGGQVVRAGMARVGETGPELLNLPRGAQVIPLPRVPNISGRAKDGNSQRPIYLVLPNGDVLAQVVNRANDDAVAFL